MIAWRQPITSTGSPTEGHMLLRRLRWRPTKSVVRPPLQPWAASPGGRQGAATAAASAAAAKGRRGAASDASNEASAAAAAAASPPPAPAAIDLHQHAPRWALEAGELPQRWLTFSDLHVSKNTLGTCLAVLEQVHEEAVRRGAGILFLGELGGRPGGGGAGRHAGRQAGGGGVQLGWRAGAINCRLHCAHCGPPALILLRLLLLLHRRLLAPPGAAAGGAAE